LDTINTIMLKAELDVLSSLLNLRLTIIVVVVSCSGTEYMRKARYDI